MQGGSFRRTVETVRVFVLQDLRHRYRDSVLGSIWLIAQPLALVLIFTVVLGSIMAPRLAAGGDSRDYGYYLVSGLLLWNAQANILTRLCEVYSQHAGLLKKTPIGLLSLPLYIPIVEFFGWLAGFAVMGCVMVIFGDERLILFPIFGIVTLFSLIVHYLVGLIFSMLSVFLPDIKSAMPVILQLWFWLTPIAYTIDLQPVMLQNLQRWNPLYWGPSISQALMSEARQIDMVPFIALTCLAIFSIIVANFLHGRLERDIRDLI